MKKMKTERSFKDRRKKGVSPVIGVILMVAATIVIAAVVLAMLGGFGPPRRNYVVMASATDDALGTTLYVTYQGGPDSAQLTNCTCTINGAVPTIEDFDTPITPVGDVASGLCTAGLGNDHVVVSCAFIDGSSQVILDTYV
jgi:flagellin-like protein